MDYKDRIIDDLGLEVLQLFVKINRWIGDEDVGATKSDNL